MKAPDWLVPDNEYEPVADDYVIPNLTVYPPDDTHEEEVLLFGPDGEPLLVSALYRPFPFGFCRPEA